MGTHKKQRVNTQMHKCDSIAIFPGIVPWSHSVTVTVTVFYKNRNNPVKKGKEKNMHECQYNCIVYKKVNS